MLEYIKENNIWNYLAKSNKPIIVYGMGDAAEKIIATLKQYGAKVSDIFASDEFVRGHSFLGYKVMKYSEICEKYDDFNIVLAFATHLPDMLNKIESINKEHPVFAPDVPVAGGGLFTREYICENEKKFDFVYEHLADELSRKTYIDILNFKISGKIEYLFSSFCDKEEVYSNILTLDNNETIVDLGAYDGDTIREITTYTSEKYNKIYAFEPDEKNYKKLALKTAHMDNISLFNMGAWDKKDTLFFAKKAGRNSKLSAGGVPVKVTDLDSVINEKITLLKMDIEGSELKALCGAERLIEKHLPKLYVCAYHRNEDLFSLGEKILNFSNSYKLYFRHHPYIPAWESNFYAVAK